MDTLVSWLQETYWASERPPEAIERAWTFAPYVFGLYHAEAIIGCARVVTDTVGVAYLADVFILPEYRGNGLGTWLMEAITGHPDLQTVRWLLHTRDAHDLYSKFGFERMAERLMERPRSRRFD